jgi:hypothetical protein
MHASSWLGTSVVEEDEAENDKRPDADRSGLARIRAQKL